jgi:hypothetical protein
VSARFLVGLRKGKKQFGRPGHQWEDEIKMLSSRSGMGTWTGIIWLKIVLGGGLF